MSLEIDADFPALELVDINGRPGNTDELASTGMPVLIVTSALSRLCRALTDMYLEIARLDENSYQVWMLAYGPSEYVRAAFGDLDERVRVFAFDSDWDGLEALGVTCYPTLIYSGVGNKVEGVIEGWDRAEWQSGINDLRALHGLLPIFLSRKLPPPAATLVDGGSEGVSA